MPQLDFDASTVTPSNTFEAVPAGWYTCVISDSEMVATKAGNGSYLKLTFEVTDGDHTGRKLWANLNLDNPSDQAVQIARGELSSICRAVGILKPKDSEELHFLPMGVKVGQRKRGDTGELVNEIKGYRSAVLGGSNGEDSTVSTDPAWIK